MFFLSALFEIYIYLIGSWHKFSGGPTMLFGVIFALSGF